MESKQALINAISSFAEAVVASTKASNFARGAKTALKNEKAAAKKVMRLILGRIPTDEEVDQLIVG